MPQIDDPYIQKNGVLKNKLGLTVQDELNKVEADKTSARLALIEKKGPKEPFNYERLKATHHYIFQDIYEWAGQPRTTSLSKGHSNFTPSYLIQHHTENLFTGLERNGFFKNLKPTEFVEKISEFFAYLNQIHPFREGNGRTQRAFTKALAKEAGYDIAFEISTKERMIDISIKSQEGDLSGMSRFFKEAIDPVRSGMMRKALNFLSKTYQHWNEVYIATTEIGHSYKGLFVSQAATDFMMRTNKGEIIIGNVKDLEKLPSSGDRVSFTSKHATEFQKTHFVKELEKKITEIKGPNSKQRR